ASAKADLATCQACHGIPGSSDFGGGDVSSVSCATAECHSAAGAHPTNWQGSNDANNNGYSASHRVVTQTAIDTGCALCHQVAENGPVPLEAAPSCFSATFTNSDGSTTGCHPRGPGEGAHDLPYTAPELHGASAKADLAACQACHGIPGSSDFGGGDVSSVSCATAQCHSAAGAHPTDWKGENDPSPDYLSSHRNAGRQSSNCALCHDYTEGRTPPLSGAPSCYADSFTNSDGSTTSCHGNGPGAGHALPFTDPADHGPEAKANLRACAACHATPAEARPGDNPRFNLPVGDLPQGCETSGCHSPYTAHPTPLWSGTTSHASAGHQAEACALCHGENLDGGGSAVGPACTSCHELGSPLVLTDCTSCHATPPDEADSSVGARPNRDGAHTVHQDYAEVRDNCGVCHTNAGANTENHFDTSAPASVQISSAYNALGSTAGFNSSSSTCSNVSCHGGQATPDWYRGSINIATDCESCHAYGSSEYNSYRSGGHGEHRRLSCSRCHDTAELADPNSAHLSNLATAAFEQDASDTLLPLSQSCQQSGCHGSGTDFGDWWDD
ncbi:MAG: CxxxxCH/CxxCH domain-containing protein, partial [Desulfosarcinaceae bacterium]